MCWLSCRQAINFLKKFSGKEKEAAIEKQSKRKKEGKVLSNTLCMAGVHFCINGGTKEVQGPRGPWRPPAPTASCGAGPQLTQWPTNPLLLACPQFGLTVG